MSKVSIVEIDIKYLAIHNRLKKQIVLNIICSWLNIQYRFWMEDYHTQFRRHEDLKESRLLKNTKLGRTTTIAANRLEYAPSMASYSSNRCRLHSLVIDDPTLMTFTASPLYRVAFVWLVRNWYYNYKQISGSTKLGFGPISSRDWQYFTRNSITFSIKIGPSDISN